MNKKLDFTPEVSQETPSNTQWVNTHTMGFKPSTDLEGKALFLEETLEKMQSYKDFLWRKRGYLRKTKKCTKSINEKLKSVTEGIEEVHQKCLAIWNDIELDGKA